MSNFRKPKQFNPALRDAGVASKNALGASLGFSDSDGDMSGSGSESESEASNQSDGEGGGISFLEYLTLQKSLRKVTEQKIELSESLKSTRDRLKKAEKTANRAQMDRKTQVAILQKAQEQQMAERDSLVDSLRLTIEEIESDGDKTEGIRKMVETITNLSNEKRELYEKSESNAALAEQAVKDLEEAEKEYETKIKELEQEKAELQGKIDPVKVAQAASAAAAPLNNKEIDTLRKELADLRSQLRDAQDSTSSAGGSGSGVSSAEASKFKADIAKAQTKSKQLQQQLEDANGEIAKLRSLSATGSDQDKQKEDMMNQLSADLNTAKKSSRDLEEKVSTLASQLKQKEIELTTANDMVASLQASLEQQLGDLKAAGDDAKTATEAKLAETSQKLSSAKSKLKAEKSQHEATTKDLEVARKELKTLKDSLSALESSSSDALKAERERAATALQNAKADGAAQLATAKERAKEQMKDMREKLNTVGSQVGPMLEHIKFISKQYKALRKETRDLQGEIEPTVKQCRRDLLRALADVDKNYKEMLRKYRKEMAARKKLHNELVDLKGSIRVFARIRPLIDEDKGGDNELVINADEEDNEVIHVRNKGKDSTFGADVVFSPTSTQEQVFTACRDLVVSVIDGYNVCIFAYGQTGSGKTFTMEGSDEHPGLNRRALRTLFDVCEEKSADWSYEIAVSVLEIYNEKLRDLLGDSPKKSLDIKHGRSGPQVPGLSIVPVKSVEEVRKKYKKAQSFRSVASTDMNDASSRSHAILVVYVTGTNLSTGVQTKGKLNLIDLAGSERVMKSGAIDDKSRLSEANNINKSLSSLGDVIHALGAKQKHVPYRNSKLTHLLQDSLGGAAKTLMVVQVAPVKKNVSESVCSLNFAARVRAVELGSAKKTSESAEVSALKKRIKELERR